MAATVLTRALHSSAENKPLLAEQIAADRVLIRLINLIALASDTSFYRLIPKAVVFAKDETEIASLFQFSQRQGIPTTLPAAGSSLSGQSISDGLLSKSHAIGKTPASRPAAGRFAFNPSTACLVWRKDRPRSRLHR
jgi:hypothetical protein